MARAVIVLTFYPCHWMQVSEQVHSPTALPLWNVYKQLDGPQKLDGLCGKRRIFSSWCSHCSDWATCVLPKCTLEDTISFCMNRHNPLSISCDSIVHISVYKTYKAVLVAGPVRELSAGLRPVLCCVRRPEFPARSATPYVLSNDTFVRSPLYLRATTRSKACPVSCLVTLCVCVCVCVCV